MTGLLLDLGDYPGFLPDPEGTGRVRGELLFLAGEPFEPLDRYEGFHPEDPGRSLFVRERAVARAASGEHSCWIYRYAGPREGHALVASGDWLA